MVEIAVKRIVRKPVKYLKAYCGVRYWEDATVNGVVDEDGSRIPFRNGDVWEPLIDLEAGMIHGWPEGVTADIHYKVCDDGSYALLDPMGVEIALIDGYAPSILAYKKDGFGDYVIMSVNGHGKITNWPPADDLPGLLKPWEADHDA